MKYSILINILFDLLSKRRVTAPYLSERYEISTRTVYRYVEILSAHLPVQVKRGRDGGICVPDNYKLPIGFLTEREYETTTEALALAYSRDPDERYLEAKRKLSAEKKSETRPLYMFAELGALLLNGEPFGDTRTQTDKLRLIEFCIERNLIMDIEYLSEKGERESQKIEPHLIAFDREKLYVYAFCHLEREFRLLSIGRIVSASKTKGYFRRRPFKNEDVPLSLHERVETVDVCFEVQKSAVERVVDWLGAETVRKQGNKYYAEATLPVSEPLVRRILSFGTGIKLLSPENLREQIKNYAVSIARLYK